MVLLLLPFIVAAVLGVAVLSVDMLALLPLGLVLFGRLLRLRQ